MTQTLQERLRNPPMGYAFRTMEEAADRIDALERALEWISLGPGYHESKEDAVLEMMRVASAALTPSERKDG